MACLTSVTNIMQMNGHQGGDFVGGKGLKQGDPLSPLLFVLSMEYFSRLMKRASLQSGFTYHPHCKHMQLTHLLFANDVLIFCKAHPPTLQIITTALNDFHTCVGLQSNQSKTQIYLVAVTHTSSSNVFKSPDSRKRGFLSNT